MHRKRFGLEAITRIVVILFMTGGLLTLSCLEGIAAAEKSERSEILEKARKEGTLVLYTGTVLTELKEIIPAFEKRHPFLKVNYFRSTASRLFAKAQAEYGAGKYLVDIFASSLWGAQQYFESGFLGTYQSPERESILEASKDQDGYWTGDYIHIEALAYNTRLVPPAKRPRSYQDLLDPFWKGKLGVSQDTGFRWYGCMLKILGEEKGRLFMQKLAQQQIRFYRGSSLVTNLLAAGEFSAALLVHHTDIENLRRAGAPLEAVLPLDQPVISIPHTIAIAKHPPHPNAAKLYIDFILSKEGQELMARLKYLPVRTDVSSDLLRLIKGPDGKERRFLPIDLGLVKKLSLLQKEFNQLFGHQEGK